MTGKELRLGQLFKTAGRTFILPMDHGVTIGPVTGLRNIRAMVRSVKDSVDAVLVHKGLIPQVLDGLGPYGCQLIVHLSASTVLSPDPARKELVTSVEYAVKRGAAAVSVHVNLGSDTEVKMLQDLGNTAEQCEHWGIPLLAMMYVRDGNPQHEYDPEKIRHAARVAEELGADIVKVNYTGSVETFSEVVESVKIPVIIAGGPKMASDADLLVMTAEAVKAGARGVAIGRNIFQHARPAELAGALRRILDDASPEDTSPEDTSPEDAEAGLANDANSENGK